MPAIPEPVTVVPLPGKGYPGNADVLDWLDRLGVPLDDVLEGYYASVRAGLVTLVVFARDAEGRRYLDPGGYGYAKALLTVPAVGPLPAPLP